MSLFQTSVVKKYLNDLSPELIDEKYKAFQDYFGNAERQENIRNSKEEEYQSGFVSALFVNILEYTLNPEPSFNFVLEKKNVDDSKKADGAILKDNEVIAVIELKSTQTTDLGKVETQAFGYKVHNPKCVYVITSNFEKLRFYIHNTVDHVDFDLFNLTREQFSLMWLCLLKDNLINDLPLKIKEASVLQEENVTKQLYNDYSKFRKEIFANIVKNNPEFDKLVLFKKTQKLLDRFLFIFFAEDKLLVPPNSISEIVKQWITLKDDLDEYVPLYDRFKKYFGYLNTGFKGKKYDIFAYNGGLFLPDEILDNIKIDDEILHQNTLQLSTYDFETEVDVNILGHIFEHSLSEIENVQAEIAGEVIDKQKTKRKKDGIFYTPKYITKYIVENTVGKLCEEKRNEFEIIDEEYAKGRRKRKKDIVRDLDNKLTEYRKWLLEITILDPACGSGAFLNQALEFLIHEHKKVDELKAQLLGGSIIFPDIEAKILEKNIFGVDLNEESVEIAKLSLWLRTAQKGRKLTILSNNIKCGNSLIDDPEIAGEKAFNWQNEFSEVFANGGFDVVIGNPPYGAYLNESEKSFYQKNIKSFQGNFEIYFFFIEYCTNLLKEKGILSFITPDTWIKIPQAQKLREFVISNYGINEIISFDYSVFHDASVNPIIFILSYKTFNEKCSIISITNIDEIMKLYSKSSLYFCTIKDWTESQDKQFQIYQTDDLKKLLSKIKRDTVECSELLDVSQGIVPYSKEHLSIEDIKNRIYHSNERVDQDYGMWVQGRAINRYSINIEKHEYLKYGSWLHRPRKPKYFQNERILIQEITGGNPPRISAIKFSEVLYHDPGIISCLNTSSYNMDYILSILNSKLLSWYHVVNSPKGKRTTFPKVLIGDIRKFPIRKTNNSKQEILSKMVNLILNQSQLLLFEKNCFLQTLKEEKQVEKITKKIGSFYELSYEIFKKELKKQKVELSLGDENNKWRNYFNSTVEKINQFQSEITKTDKEIDQMVYELYDLTEEEIKIVEETN